MALTMRPTGLGHRVYQNSIDYGVFSGAWLIGCIYERHRFPADVRLFWSLHDVALTRTPEIHTDGHEPTLEMTKARLKRSWERWLNGKKPNDPARTARGRRVRLRTSLYRR